MRIHEHHQVSLYTKETSKGIVCHKRESRNTVYILQRQVSKVCLITKAKKKENSISQLSILLHLYCIHFYYSQILFHSKSFFASDI